MQIARQHSIKLIACLAMGLSLAASNSAWAEPHSDANTVPSLALADAQSGQALESYMEYMVDPSGMATLLELFSPSYKDAFTPLEHDIPLTDTGSTWFRLAITPESNNSHVIALDSELATDVVLYVPDFAQYIKNKASATTPWQEIFIPHGEAITLPSITDAKLLEQAQNISVPIYIRMAGTPEPWFAPKLRTITDIAHDTSHLIHLAITMMLAAVLALCLLRAFTEKGQWRLWTTFFTAALLVESLVGLPNTPHGSIGLTGLANVLAPAIALMLLPHIARHMLRRTEFSHKHISAPHSLLDSDLDRQYRFLSIPCILIAIVPLLPNLGWLGKLLPLWPLAIILFLPTTIIALFRKISGAKLFFVACLIGILGAVGALAAMFIGMSASIINAIPLGGTALCALCLAGIHGGQTQPTTEHASENTQSENKPTMTIHENYDEPLIGEGLRLVSASEGLATGIVYNGEVMADDKSIKNNTIVETNTSEPLTSSDTIEKALVAQTIAHRSEQGSDQKITCELDGHAHTEQTPDIPDLPKAELNTEINVQTASSVTALETPSKSLAASLRGPLEQDDVQTLARAEEAMRYPLEKLRKSMESLQKCALSPDTKILCQDAANASKQLDLVGEEFRRTTYRLPSESASMIFDLQRCLREAHDNVCERSDAKNIALSWFMAPHLVQTYQGDENRLRTTLRMLMESAVDATDKGSVYLSARRVPDSTNPGHLLFTITDTGAGGPPERRKASALMQAWELATSTGGSLSIDSGVHGTTISFSTRFLAIHNDNTPSSTLQHRINGYNGLANSMHPKSGKQACIVIAAPAASNRQLLAFYLEDTAYYAEEAVSTLDIMAKYTSRGAELIILDGDMNEDESSKVIATARQYEAENDLPPVPFLALVRDEAQADAFLQRGCTQTLLKPVTRSGLCAQVALLAPVVLIPKAIDEMQSDEKQNAETNVVTNQQNIVAPELINAAITEAMDLLTEPAQDPVTTFEHSENIPESHQESMTEAHPELIVPIQEPTPEPLPEPEPVSEPVLTPESKDQTPAQAETPPQMVPTSEAEDITLRLFEEHLQSEKSSVLPSMLDLDPILFTDILSEPTPKPKKRNTESSVTLGRNEYNASSDDVVSAARVATPQKTEPVAEPAPTSEAQKPKTESSELSCVESPNQFIYNDIESEVSKPRPMHEDAEQNNVAPVAKPTQQPEPSKKSRPEPRGDEVCVEAITVGTEFLRLYKVPTKRINPDDEYEAMLEREAQLRGQQKATQSPQTVTWHEASEITTQVTEPVLDVEPAPMPIPEPTVTPEPIVISKPITEPESIVEPNPIVEPESIVEPNPIVEPESIVEPKQIIEQMPTVEPLETVQSIDSLVPIEFDQPIKLEQPIAPAHVVEYVEPIQTNTLKKEITREEDSTDEAESGCPDLEKPNAVTRVTSTLFNVYNKLREPAPLNVMDKNLPSLNKIREAFEVAGLSQEQDDIQEAQGEPRHNEPSPRFVSIVQEVNEIAASIRPATSVTRNSSHKNFVPQLITELEQAITEAMTGYEQDDIGAIEEAAARVADTAEALGLRSLERSTRCVERAAMAGDLASARELYPDMAQTIQHTLTALRSSGLDGAHRI